MRCALLLPTVLVAAAAVSSAHSGHVHISVSYRSRGGHSEHARDVHTRTSTMFSGAGGTAAATGGYGASSNTDFSNVKSSGDVGSSGSSGSGGGVTVELPTPTSAPACTLPPNTLSFACDSACAPFSPCVRVDGSRPSATATRATAALATSACSYECFQINSAAPQSYSAFTFLVPFGGAWKSSQELAKTFTSEDVTARNDTKTTASESNALLQRVEPLALPNTTTTVKLQGGSTIDTQVTRGRVANVELASALLTKQSHVTGISLANLRLEPYTDALVGMVPPTVTALVLNNGLLTRLPSGLATLKKLKKLSVNRNYIKTIPWNVSAELLSLTTFGANKNGLRSFETVLTSLMTLDLSTNNLTAMPTVLPNHTSLKQLYIGGNQLTAVEKTDAIKSLTELYISHNRISRFDALFPSLTILNLANNSLTAIPPIVFNHSKLRDLRLAYNPLANMTITLAQANFLASLTTFTISQPSEGPQSCASGQMQVIKKVTFCIADGALTPTLIPSASKANSSTIKPSPTKAIGTKSDDRNSSGVSITAIMATVSVTLLLLVGIAFVYRRMTAGFRKPPSNASSAGETNASGSVSAASKASAGPSKLRLWSRNRTSSSNAAAVSVWDDPELRAMQVPVDDIKDVRRLGGGAYGDVWLVKLRGVQVARESDANALSASHVYEPVLLASKRLKQLVDPSEREQNRARSQAFIAEIKLVAMLKHPKIVAFIGAAWTVETDLQALFEYMSGGDLRSVLDDPRTPRAWSLRKIQLALDVAEAIAFCHAFAPPLVHRDLKSRNVLLIEDGASAKLADFGVARFLSQANTMTVGVGTARWLAPEMITGDGDYGTPADIFSFGVVLSELDSHEFPYASEMKRREIIEVALLQLVAAGEVMPRINASCPDAIAELATRCLALDPEQRPSAVELAYELRMIKKQLV